MGHERVGRLPRSKRWVSVIEEIREASGEPGSVARVAGATLENVRERLDRVESDSGVAAAFEYLIALTHAGASVQAEIPIVPDLSERPTPARLALQLCEWVDEHRGALEYAEMAKQAAADAIAEWSTIESSQEDLFPEDLNIQQRWKEASTGAGFSEVAREFFARLTERYLRYFLDREASASSGSIEARERFAANLRAHVESVSRHAFETSKITQSFAAGWYNRHARDRMPTAGQRRGFLRLAFQKIREELAREAGVE